MECTEKGFIVEVAGINNPKVPPFVLATSGKSKGKQWIRMELDPIDSPHTIYAAEFTESEANESDWKLYLNAPGLKNPLLIAPYDEEDVQASGNGVLPTGYRCEPYSFQDYIFIPFRPVTAIAAPNSKIGGNYNYLGHGEYGCDHAKIEDEKDIKCHLRLLRKGYLYIFRGKKLWREIEVFEDGTFLDIDLACERPEQPQENKPWPLRTKSQNTSGKEKEIWLPVRIGIMRGGKSIIGGIASEFRIAFCDAQWTWSYIAWLESDISRVKKRLDSLYDIYKKYTHVSTGRPPQRFTPLINETKLDGKFYSVNQKRTDILTEAVGVCRRISNSDHWKNAGKLRMFALAKSDLDIFTKLYSRTSVSGISEEYNQIKKSIDPVFGTILEAGVSNGRGLYIVNDYLYNPLFYAIRAKFYADMLKGFDLLLLNKQYAATIWQMFDSLRYTRDEKEVFTKHLDMSKLESVICPNHRRAVKKMLEESINDLILCLGSDKNNRRDTRGVYELGNYDFPSAHENKVKESLHDYFSLDNNDYLLKGWSWINNIASALAIDPGTADSCNFDYEIRCGLKSNIRKSELDPMLFSMEKWDCNGITLRQMMYPDIEKYPVSQPLERNSMEVEINDGSGLCRFQTLLSMLQDSNSDPQKEIALSIITGVGAIFYQKHLESVMAKEATYDNALSEELKYPVNLLRLADLTDMILISAEQLNSNICTNYKILICDGSNTQTSQNNSLEPLPTNTEPYVIHKISEYQYIARMARNNSITLSYMPLLLIPKTTQLFTYGNVSNTIIGGINIAAIFKPALNICLLISSINMIVCVEVWRSGENNSKANITFALNALGNSVNFFAGAAAGEILWNTKNTGLKFAELLENGEGFAVKNLKRLWKLGYIVGAVDFGYHAHQSASRGDDTAAIFYSAGTLSCALAITVGILASGLPTGGLAPALGALGLLGGAIGAFFTSSELKHEILNCVYGNTPNPSKDLKFSGDNGDDNAYRLLKCASPITVEYPASEDIKKYEQFITFIGLKINNIKYKVLRISWPLFAHPFVKRQISNGKFLPQVSCSSTISCYYLYLEDRCEVFVFPVKTGDKITIIHENEEFAYITINNHEEATCNYAPITYL